MYASEHAGRPSRIAGKGWAGALPNTHSAPVHLYCIITFALIKGINV